MSAAEAYGAFAYAYDQALGARFFKAARKLLEEIDERYPTPKRTHLDVACGTGMSVAYFRERGWKSYGVDASMAMLQVARKRATQLVAADFSALPFRRRFARITCLYDSLNHLLEREELVAAFQAMRALMDQDSLLLFDMNHPEIYPEVWGTAEPYISSAPDSHLEIATSYRSRQKLAKALVRGWAMINGERVEIREQHRQRAYSEREITSALDEARLGVVDVMDFDPYGEAHDIEAPTVKLFFVCRAV